jgi:hypothetical protein
MTKDEALKMAIEWMDKWHDKEVIVMNVGQRWVDFSMPIQACKEALEQPTQEPVGFVVGSENYPDINIGQASITDSTLAVGTPLYTLPHQWQGLTDDEREILYDKAIEMPLENLWNDYAYLIEQALKEKNT